MGPYVGLFIGATVVGTIVMWYWMKRSGLLDEEKDPTNESKAVP
jgi:hypothetical protein